LNSLYRIPEYADNLGCRGHARNPLPRFTGSEVGGRNFSHSASFYVLWKMGSIPVNATLKMHVEKAGLFGRMRQGSSLAQDLMEPTRTGSRRSNHVKRGKDSRHGIATISGVSVDKPHLPARCAGSVTAL
jgi:hypothetical protein